MHSSYNRAQLINLYIKERQVGNVTVLDLKGRVRVGGATVALHRSFRSLVQEEKLLILLNLAGVTHIDSVGSVSLFQATFQFSIKVARSS